jgi:CRISPR type I-E-associated protein CasB/Cse2
LTTTYRLVDHLSQASQRGDGATLGALRRGWSQPLALYPIVAPYLPIPASRHAEDVSMLVARLFGENPKAGNVFLPIALQRLDSNSATAEARMVSILSAPFVDLPRLLRRAVARLAAERIAIDWHRLMDDLLRWNAEDQTVQRAWARMYWGTSEGMTAKPIEEAP